MGIFFKGLFGPRRKPSPLIIWLPCFKYTPLPTMPSLEPFQMVSNTALNLLFQLLQCLSFFSNTIHFPWSCLSLFAPKPIQHLIVPQSPMLGERSLPKMAKPLQPNLRGTRGTHPLFSYCEQHDVYSFSLWCLFHSDKFLSFCSLVNWSKQNITPTQIFIAKTNAHRTFCINGVFQFLLLIFRNVYWYVCVRHIYYM